MPVLTPQHVVDAYLPPGATKLILAGIPPLTVQTYARRWRAFRLWCENQRPKRTFAPVSEETLITYLHHLSTRPMHPQGCSCREHRPAPGTIWVWYSAVRWYHRMGVPPLPWDMGNRIRLAMKGYADQMVEAGWAPDRAPRAYPEDVRAWIDALDMNIGKHLQARAIILMGWYTAARASDLATYRISDVVWTRMTGPGGISVPAVDLQLRSSKANKQPGRVVEHRAFAADLANPQWCGMVALREWIGHLDRQYDFRAGSLLQPFAPGNMENPPLVLQRDPSFKISGDPINRAIRNAAKRAGYPNWADYSEHSLRRGRAQFLYEEQVPELEIARHHGWADKGVLRDYLSESDRLSPTAPGAIGLL